MVLYTNYARKYHGFLLSLIVLSNVFLIGIILSTGLLFRMRGLFLVLLVLAARFLCRLHRVYLSGRKSS